MAIKIRCTSCSKKISVDDAFAGGMCRCPYCTETVPVPDKRGGRSDTAGLRPDAPSVAPVAAPTPVPEAPAHHIPVANPVRTQWILLLILLVIMAGGGIAAIKYLAWQREQQEKQQRDDDGQANVDHVDPVDAKTVGANDNTNNTNNTNRTVKTVKTVKAAIAGMEIRGPVVYCMDNSRGMRRVFDMVSAMTQASIESLGKDRRFTLLVCARRDSDGNGRMWEMPGGYHAGGLDGRVKADRFLSDVIWFGDVDLPGTIAKALELKAKTIVLCGRMKVANPKQLGAKAKSGGATIVTVAITSDDEIAASLAALAKASGGQTRKLEPHELETLIYSAN